jgi:hypothetical protein
MVKNEKTGFPVFTSLFARINAENSVRFTFRKSVVMVTPTGEKQILKSSPAVSQMSKHLRN